MLARNIEEFFCAYISFLTLRFPCQLVKYATTIREYVEAKLELLLRINIVDFKV